MPNCSDSMRQRQPGRKGEQEMCGFSSTRRPKKSDLSCAATKPSKFAQIIWVGSLRIHSSLADIDYLEVGAEMQLQPNIGSDRSWVWKVHADYADGEPKSETLAIRFANAESELFF